MFKKDFGMFDSMGFKKGGRVGCGELKKVLKRKNKQKNREKIMPGTMMMKRPMMKKGEKGFKTC